MASTVLPYVWGAMMALLLIGAVIMSRFYRRLRTYHPDTWRELGAPTLILNSSLANQHRVNRFMWKGEYRKLDDPTLDAICMWGKVLGLLTLALFLVSFMLILYQID